MSSTSLLDLLNFNENLEKRKDRARFIRRNVKYSADMDFVETPPEAVEALLSVERFEGDILEPCAGKGAISKILIAHGYNVISRDLVDRNNEKVEANKDYFASTEMFGNVITNPPYRKATQFAYHAIQHVYHKVAFLLRGTFLETPTRRDWLFENPELPTCFEKLYVFSERLPFGESNMIMYCWFLWNKQFHGNHPTIHWL
jgi:hypothetical protein